MRRTLIGIAYALVAMNAPAHAQFLRSDPVTLAGGRLTLGGDASVTMAPPDPDGFNYTEYEYSAVRMAQVDIAGSFAAGRHISVLGQIRTENFETGQLLALYLRVRPWTKRGIDIQVGRVPPSFGSFPRRQYNSDDPFIGYPLAYQYLTSLRPDAVPANADELLRMRGHGQLSSFSIGDQEAYPGVPLANAFRWGDGIQVHAANRTIEATGALMLGSLSDPTVSGDNDGRQVVGRMAVHPTPGLIIGASAAFSPFIVRSAVQALPAQADGHALTQQALGADVEYSRAYYVVRFEMVVDRWHLPEIEAPLITKPLQAMATFVEGRYKIRPGFYVAGRIEHLGFSDVVGSSGRSSWEAPVSRLEVGGGYSIQRNMVVKLFYQYDARIVGSPQRIGVPAVQLKVWI
jgi:hypothetical protein